MKLMLISSEGEVLDSTDEFTLDEWKVMQTDYDFARNTLYNLSEGAGS